MNNFIGQDFLLNNKIAKTLYHDYAVKMPIIDYHCHVSPQEIANDCCFENLAQAWLDGDHYKWRLMRNAGVDENLITGDAPDYDRFRAFAEIIPQAAGNPVYTWAHLELQRYFDCDLVLSKKTADAIWQYTQKKLSEPEMSVRGIIARSNVKIIATTDDPADSLEWHKKIKQITSFKTKVIPTFRPDKFLTIEKPDFAAYIHSLDTHIHSWADLQKVLSVRMDYFNEQGCRAADHGLPIIPYCEYIEPEIESIVKKALKHKTFSQNETEKYKTALLLFLGRQYAKRDWVMQLHYGPMRNVNSVLYNERGPDIGNDAVSGVECSGNTAKLLDRLNQSHELPKTILYSLNPHDNIFLQTIGGCFSRVQHGSAWWFNDTKTGIEAQLINLANCGLLGGFVGMLTDSRSFLSYTRHEYFRRILCNVIGGWVENGEYTADMETLGEMVQNISYNNVEKFFGFGIN